MSNNLEILAKLFRRTVAGCIGIALIVFCISLGLLEYTQILKDYRVLEDSLINLLSEFIGASFIYLLVFGFLEKAEKISRESEIQEQIVKPISEKIDDHCGRILVNLDGQSGRILTALRSNDKTVSSEIDTIDWADLFSHTDEIFLLVQGWDGWKTKVAKCLPDFLNRGGRIQVILHDPTEQVLLERMAERMGGRRTEADEKREIEMTFIGLKEVTKQYPNQLTCYYTKRMNWFCGIYFKSNGCRFGKLLLSIYQHQPTKDDLAINNVPSFLIRTDVFPELGVWFDNEWKHLVKDASPSK